MKTLKDIIVEKLVITKDTKEKLSADIKGKTCFTPQEIDEIYNFAQSLKIKPVKITNQYVSSTGDFSFDENIIFMHFYNEWETIPPYRKAYEDKDKLDKIITIRFSKIYGKCSYNCLTNKHNWLYITASSVNSCKEAIDCMKNDFKKNYKDYI